MCGINARVIIARALSLKCSAHYFDSEWTAFANKNFQQGTSQTREERSMNTRLNSATKGKLNFFRDSFRSSCNISYNIITVITSCNSYIIMGPFGALTFLSYTRTGRLEMQIVLEYVTRIHGRALCTIYVCLRSVNHRRLRSPSFFQTHRRFPGPPASSAGVPKVQRRAIPPRLVRRRCSSVSHSRADSAKTARRRVSRR